jgi:hypothetical protein
MICSRSDSIRWAFLLNALMMVRAKKTMAVAIWYPTDVPAAPFVYGGPSKGFVAMDAPLKTVRACRAALRAAAALVEIANPNLISDVGVAAKPEYLEGPWVERVGGKHVLFYAEIYKDRKYPEYLGYRTGAAYADRPMGPWKKDPRAKVFFGGHLAVFDGPDGRKWFLYRQEQYDRTCGPLCIDPFDVDGEGKLQAIGPTTTEQTVRLRPALKVGGREGPGRATGTLLDVQTWGPEARRDESAGASMQGLPSS